MSKQFHAFLLIGVSFVSLSACSGDKGPGVIGSKDDIVVVNKGIPGAQQPAQGMKAEGEDFTSTVEQAQAAPAPEVAAAEELTPAPAAEEAQQTVEESTAPTGQSLPTSQPVAEQTVAAPPQQPQTPTPSAAASAVPSTDNTSVSTSAPSPVSETSSAVTTPAPTPSQAPAPVTAQDPAASTPAPAPAPAPVADKKIPYPLDPNAPYSPKAMAAAAAAAGTPVVAPEISPSGVNLNDPAIIRSVQAKMAEQKLFVGPQTGMMSADLMNAVAQYQVRNNLAIGPLNEETLKHMGILKN